VPGAGEERHTQTALQSSRTVAEIHRKGKQSRRKVGSSTNAVFPMAIINIKPDGRGENTSRKGKREEERHVQRMPDLRKVGGQNGQFLLAKDREKLAVSESEGIGESSREKKTRSGMCRRVIRRDTKESCAQKQKVERWEVGGKIAELHAGSAWVPPFHFCHPNYPARVIGQKAGPRKTVG